MNIVSADHCFRSLTPENKPHKSRVIISFSKIRATFGCLFKNHPPEFYLSEINNSQNTAGTAIPLSLIKLFYFSDKAQGIALRIDTI